MTCQSKSSHSTMGWGATWSDPGHDNAVEQRVNNFTNQVVLLISHFHKSANKSVEMAAPDDEVGGFITQAGEGVRGCWEGKGVLT